MLKRMFDFILAGIGLFFIWPFLLVLALMVKASSPGPVFYRGVRAGQYDTTFRIFKFRTMVANAEAVGGVSTALNDSRLTAGGKFMRKYKLDELPQLLNIIKGEMSFVGPRPQVLKYTKLYEGKFKQILDAKPGITDFASIEFINLDEILGDGDVDLKYQQEVEPRKNELRLKYVLEQSFKVDMYILWRTLGRLLGAGGK